MANKRVRLVRSVQISGKSVQCKPGISAKCSVNPEWVFYKRQQRKVPAEGRWYIRWEEGHKPKWQACQNMSDAIHQQIRKQVELRAVAVGVEVKSDDPHRLRLTDAFLQYIADQELLRRSKKMLAAHRDTKDSFLKSCQKTYLDQVTAGTFSTTPMICGEKSCPSAPSSPGGQR